MADTVHPGKEIRAYVNAGGAPALNPELAASYTLVGLESNHTFSYTGDVSNAVHKDAGAFQTGIITTQGHSLQLEVVYPVDGNTGIQILVDAAKSQTDSGQKVGFILTTGVSADRQIRGVARVSSMEISAPVDGFASASFTLVGDGAFIEEAVS